MQVFRDCYNNYPFKSEIPRRINNAPIITINQNNPPLKNVPAAVQKSHAGLNQFEDIKAIQIGTIIKINPSKSSDHLFMFCY